jgi:nicotinamide mononucleotide (NMN) deamidase PncC
MAVDVGGDVSSFEVRMPGRRRQIRELSCISALNLVRTKLMV